MSDADTTVAALPNGVRVVAIRAPHAATASVGVYVRCGSLHESAASSGVGHVIEHMAFKGTRERDARRINLDAERLGADVNAHTDKDHTAFYMRGLARHAESFVAMLADIVLHASFPAAELERERAVLLHEFTEDEEDPMSTAFKLFDRACYGLHPAAQPVIGTRRNIQRFARDDLAAHVHRLYTGANVVVGVAGDIDSDAICRAAEVAFGAMPRGAANVVDAPRWSSGVRARALEGNSQAHVVLGFPLPPPQDDDLAGTVAAALFGDGMSSPLLLELRERRAVVYHAACSADLFDGHGQFVVEASTAPERLDEFLREVARLLAAQAEAIDPTDLERARNQLVVRRLRTLERPGRRLEVAALDLFWYGRLQPHVRWIERVEAVDAATVRAAFQRMLAAGPAVAMAGNVGRRASERARRLFGETIR